MKKKTYIISGYPSGASGIGRVIDYIESYIADNKSPAKVVCRRKYDTSFRSQLLKRDYFNFLIDVAKFSWEEFIFLISINLILPNHDGRVVIIHPQAIGFKSVINLIKKRKGNTWIYVMDNSFFCLKSYNQLDSFAGPCLFCLGSHEKLAVYNCEPFPIVDSNAVKFITILNLLVNDNKVSFFTQCEGQSDLVRRHFNSKVVIQEIGLWAKDWFDNHVSNHGSRLSEQQFDIVFHANRFDAKGFAWTLALAERLVDLTFLFPFPLDDETIKIRLPNCFFISMNWETGLYHHVASSYLVLVPSMWTAPIEGALIKSLQFAKSVGVIDIENAFSREIPSSLILKLSLNIDTSAILIRSHIENGKGINKKDRDQWMSEFKNKNALSAMKVI